MSILSIGQVKFAQSEYEGSGLTQLTFPSSTLTDRSDFLKAIEDGKYDGVVALNRHLHDKTIGRLDREVIQKLPKSIKVIGNIGAGNTFFISLECFRGLMY